MDMANEPQKPVDKGPLSAPLNIPDMPDVKHEMPKEFDWSNISELYKAIDDIRRSGDEAAWNDAVDSVRDALRGWRENENKHNDLLKTYRFYKSLADRNVGVTDKNEQLKIKNRIADLRTQLLDKSRTGAEQAVIKSGILKLLKQLEGNPLGRERFLTQAQTAREMLPPKIRAIADKPGAAISPVNTNMVDDLSRQLEGIRQGDYESYHPDVKQRIRNYQLELEQEQVSIQKRLKELDERLNGVKDPERVKAFEARIDYLYSALQRGTLPLEPGDIPGQKRPLTEKQIERYKREVSSLTRRLTGATRPEGRAKLEEKILDEKRKIKTPDEIQQLVAKKVNSLKYDALMWVATTVAHPIKVLKTRRSAAPKPMGPMYFPPGHNPPPATFMGKEQYGVHPEAGPRPPTSECEIFSALIEEGLYEEAKFFCEDPFDLAEGDLVVLENIADDTELNGLKGRVRRIESGGGRCVTVDLFKNNIVSDPAIIVAPYEARPYIF